jgi:hypothetical protein
MCEAPKGLAIANRAQGKKTSDGTNDMNVGIRSRGVVRPAKSET